MKLDSLIQIVLIGLLAAACKVGPKYESPDFTAPDGYLYGTNSEDSLGDIRWWELFNDPVLDTLIVEALENNQDLKIALESVGQAQTSLGIQKAELLPKFNAEIATNHGNFIGIVLENKTQNYSGVAALSWEIDLWGRLRHLNDAALADYLATEYGLKSVRLALVSQVASTYLSYKEFEAAYEISIQTLGLRDSSLRLIQARFDRGFAPEIDLNQAQIQKAIAESSVHFYDRLRKQAQNILSALVGSLPRSIDSGVSLHSFSVVPDIPIGLPSEMLARRPDLQQAEQLIVAQNALLGVSIANRFPSLSLTALTGVASQDLSNLTANGLAWNVAGSLAGPLFHWGQNKRRVEIERSRLEQSYLSYEQQVINAFREVEDALVAIETYRKELSARDDHVAAATNAQFLSGERYDKGVTSYLEYLESQRQAFEAQLAQVSARRDLLDSYVQLYKALGGGWLTEQDDSVSIPNE